MGREVRRVPKNWEAPKNSKGELQPHFDQDYKAAAQEWKDGFKEWEKNPESDCEYWDWEGGPPEDAEYYRPIWKEEEQTHIMMYETCSEGTPISPAFKTPEELARWLTDNEASSFGHMTATYDQWLRVCRGGFACSAVIDGEGLKSGVAALAD